MIGSNVRVDGEQLIALTACWQAQATAPGQCQQPSELPADRWLPAGVPGTAAGALRAAGLWQHGDDRDFDAQDWWFRTSFAGETGAAHEQVLLHLDGIATVSETYLNGELIDRADSMFVARTLDVSALLTATNELTICCRALQPLLAVRRAPRARWRTKLVANGNLRFFRTMLLGRAPGFAPEPAPVGPWRGVRLRRRAQIAIEDLALRTRTTAAGGTLAVTVTLRALAGSQPSAIELELDGPSGRHSAALSLSSNGELTSATGELHVAQIARWWPHTHGRPALHEVRLRVSGTLEPIVVEAGNVGFRELAFGAAGANEIARDGLSLRVNGVEVFARGAVWTPIDAVGLAPEESQLRRALIHAREAGMNMLRLPGTATYESDRFYELCDELGILVWQDFMFANMDYPLSDESFRASVIEEVTEQLGRLAGHPSVAVLCGNSEIEQQVAMLGLEPELGRGELFGELLPALAVASGIDAAYVPSAPCGGELPFRSNEGIANYFGVGGYLRPIDDARRARVRFACECLAFSNVPSQAALEELAGDSGQPLVPTGSSWKDGIPRDAGSPWDFEDVRDHYLAVVFRVDPGELRRVDPARYLELSGAVTGHVMAQVFGEWRRRESPCSGGLVLWLSDLRPGAGWGVLDSGGEPKPSYYHLRRALAPVALWMTDEGLGGIDAHVANDRPGPLHARLRVSLYRDHEQRIEQAAQQLELPAHSAGRWSLEAVLGHFVDVSWAYRFGPAQHSLVVSSLERDDGEAAGELISQSFHLVDGARPQPQSAEQLGLSATVQRDSHGALELQLSSRRFLEGVSIHAPGFDLSDNSFCVEPGGRRTVGLQPRAPGAVFACTLTALNLDGRLRLADASAAEPGG